MGSITFGGLATGLDTGALVESLMAVEREPLTVIEADKTWLNGRLEAYQQFNTKLTGFANLVQDLNSRDEIQSREVKLSSESYFSATASSDASLSNYQVEVVALAQVQKDVTQGYASKTSSEFGTGSLSLAVGEAAAVNIDITAENNSLTGIMEAINEADIGVTAAIINDGTENPYRLVLTGENVATDFTFDASGLTGGTSEVPVSITTQPAQEAHIRVDNIDIYARSNTLTEAIPDVTLKLLQAEEGENTSVEISQDSSIVKTLIEDFVSGYNEVVSFITGQSVTEDDDTAGILLGDSGLNNIKRRLQSMLGETISTSGNLTCLSQLGLETERDGTLTINETTLSSAVTNNLEDIEKLLVGEGKVDGIATRLQDYLKGMTSSTQGFLAGQRENIESNIGRIDDRIAQMELRLDKREQTLINQFTSLELLVSQMNSTSDYMTKQLDSINNMWSWNRG